MTLEYRQGSVRRTPSRGRSGQAIDRSIRHGAGVRVLTRFVRRRGTHPVTLFRTALWSTTLAAVVSASRLGSQSLASEPDSSVRTPLPRGATVGDGAFMTMTSHVGGILGFASMIPFSNNVCNDTPSAEPTCFWSVRGPLKEGWIVGAAVGFTVGSALRARAQGCSLERWLPRAIAGAALGAAPVVLLYNSRDRTPTRQAYSLVVAPLIQSSVTALFLRSCPR